MAMSLILQASAGLSSELAAFGVNHQSAPIAVRERFSVQKDQVSSFLQDLKALPGVQGAMLLSTCNRTEIYLDCGSAQLALAEAPAWYLRERGLDPLQLQAHVYRLHGVDAVRHVFRVATGLDSLVLGETQILGQLKTAYADAKAADSIAPVLDRLLQQSFSVAKLARTDSGLGENPVSVASSAVHLAKQIFDDFANRSALIVGAGETATLLAKHLKAQGVRKLTIINRNFDRAHQLALSLDAQAVVYGQLQNCLHDVDIVACATSAERPILDKALLQKAQANSKRRMMLLLDLGVPRNIQDDCKQLRDVFLYHVDDLRHVVEQSLVARKQSAQLAEAVVDSHAQAFMNWLSARDRFETMLALRKRSETKRDHALEAALLALRSGESSDEVVKKLAFQLTNQWLHQPTEALKQAALDKDQALIQSARRLFGLDR